jgi:hypothetical protein
LTIAGFALDGDKWDGLHIGRRMGADLIYAGKVDHGFNTASAKALRARLTPPILPGAHGDLGSGIFSEGSIFACVKYTVVQGPCPAFGMERVGGPARNVRLGEAATELMAEKDVQTIMDREIAVEETLQSSRHKPPGGKT